MDRLHSWCRSCDSDWEGSLARLSNSITPLPPWHPAPGASFSSGPALGHRRLCYYHPHCREGEAGGRSPGKAGAHLPPLSQAGAEQIPKPGVAGPAPPGLTETQG